MERLKVAILKFYKIIFYKEATTKCNTMNSTIKTDLTVIEVEKIFKNEYKRMLRNQNENLILQRLEDPSYNHEIAIKYREIYAYIWTGSIKTSANSVRNEYGETFALTDFVRNRSVSRNFDETYDEVNMFPSA